MIKYQRNFVPMSSIPFNNKISKKFRVPYLLCLFINKISKKFRVPCLPHLCNNKISKKFCVSCLPYQDPNNTYIGQLKISKFTKINKQIFFKSVKQTLI